MSNRTELVSNIHEMTSMVTTEDLPKALEAITLLSDLLPPWSPKCAYSDPLRQLLDTSLFTPVECPEPDYNHAPKETQEEAEISRPLYF